MTLGQRIRQAREHRKLSIAWVAKRAGVDSRHLSEIERDKCSRIAGPGLLIVQAVAQVLDTTVGQLAPPMRACLGNFEIRRRVK